jgi:hypothetical protein
MRRLKNWNDPLPLGVKLTRTQSELRVLAGIRARVVADSWTRRSAISWTVGLRGLRHHLLGDALRFLLMRIARLVDAKLALQPRRLLPLQPARHANLLRLAMTAAVAHGVARHRCGAGAALARGGFLSVAHVVSPVAMPPPGWTA